MKKLLAFAVAVLMCGALSACGQSPVVETPAPPTPSAPDVPAYQSIDSSEYARDGKACMGYRVEIGDDATEDEMRAVYEDITAEDSYYLHTVWFYGLASDVVDVGSYTVGMLEEVSAGTSPVFSAPSYSQDVIASMRARASTSPTDEDTRSIPNIGFQQEALVPDNSFSPCPEAIFNTPASENGLADQAFYIESTVEEITEVEGYKMARLSTEYGEIYLSEITVSLDDLKAEDSGTIYFLYTGWSDKLSAAAGVYIYHE